MTVREGRDDSGGRNVILRSAPSPSVILRSALRRI